MQCWGSTVALIKSLPRLIASMVVLYIGASSPNRSAACAGSRSDQGESIDGVGRGGRNEVGAEMQCGDYYLLERSNNFLRSRRCFHHRGYNIIKYNLPFTWRSIGLQF